MARILVQALFLVDIRQYLHCYPFRQCSLPRCCTNPANIRQVATITKRTRIYSTFLFFFFFYTYARTRGVLLAFFLYTIIRLGREDLLYLKIVVLSGNRARDPLVPNNAR